MSGIAGLLDQGMQQGLRMGSQTFAAGGTVGFADGGSTMNHGSTYTGDDGTLYVWTGTGYQNIPRIAYGDVTLNDASKVDGAYLNAYGQWIQPAAPSMGDYQNPDSVLYTDVQFNPGIRESGKYGNMDPYGSSNNWATSWDPNNPDTWNLKLKSADKVGTDIQYRKEGDYWVPYVTGSEYWNTNRTLMDNIGPLIPIAAAVGAAWLPELIGGVGAAEGALDAGMVTGLEGYAGSGALEAAAGAGAGAGGEAVTSLGLEGAFGTGANTIADLSGIFGSDLTALAGTDLVSAFGGMPELVAAGGGVNALDLSLPFEGSTSPSSTFSTPDDLGDLNPEPRPPANEPYEPYGPPDPPGVNDPYTLPDPTQGIEIPGPPSLGIPSWVPASLAPVWELIKDNPRLVAALVGTLAGVVQNSQNNSSSGSGGSGGGWKGPLTKYKTTRTYTPAPAGYRPGFSPEHQYVNYTFTPDGHYAEGGTVGLAGGGSPSDGYISGGYRQGENWYFIDQAGHVLGKMPYTEYETKYWNTRDPTTWAYTNHDPVNGYEWWYPRMDANTAYETIAPGANIYGTADNGDKYYMGNNSDVMRSDGWEFGDGGWSRNGINMNDALFMTMYGNNPYSEGYKAPVLPNYTIDPNNPYVAPANTTAQPTTGTQPAIVQSPTTGSSDPTATTTHPNAYTPPAVTPNPYTPQPSAVPQGTGGTQPSYFPDSHPEIRYGGYDGPLLQQWHATYAGGGPVVGFSGGGVYNNVGEYTSGGDQYYANDAGMGFGGWDYVIDGGEQYDDITDSYRAGSDPYSDGAYWDDPGVWDDGTTDTGDVQVMDPVEINPPEEPPEEDPVVMEPIEINPPPSNEDDPYVMEPIEINPPPEDPEEPVVVMDPIEINPPPEEEPVVMDPIEINPPPPDEEPYFPPDDWGTDPYPPPPPPPPPGAGIIDLGPGPTGPGGSTPPPRSDPPPGGTTPPPGGTTPPPPPPGGTTPPPPGTGTTPPPPPPVMPPPPPTGPTVTYVANRVNPNLFGPTSYFYPLKVSDYYAQGGNVGGGIASLRRPMPPRHTKGPGDGMSDSIPATIDGRQRAALSKDEFVIPADVVSHLGNGSSEAGAKVLYAMMDRIRQARTGNPQQARQINPRKLLPR